ncbi:DNA cytosine methyltransferase [Acinetobacter baumannii]|jgi:DNA (cytosine-5)-methyltransferase 1|uniref:DNA cytosine methyltransferase n=1 Tax=Acinetobacter calcoaceticus/baumannii complex TaxID=909768 RepID=UPI000DE6E3D1|nr:DNA cytosine methyltransferase [Acinetobacter baumannii]MDR9705305.1 DNA cytosine methyltransferase [Acinetobacter baumannii]MDV7626740.1 DNA cytosine methyltransferase [Acinetobacter baumannii]SSQ98009.1 DNA cytosine methyltransferase [Acinetobacter baumannii]HAV5920976.1 DNA cytosine methyltransferase [Acinetobacter baumannii]
MIPQYTAIDLFSGAGGLTEGLKQAGFQVLAGIEIDVIAAATYKLNHPEVKCYQQDIRNIETNQLMYELGIQKGELDLLAGCPPCQGFSTLRTRKKTIALEDNRNDLIFEYLRLVEGLLPKTLMLENVPALAKDYRMSLFLKQVAELGYYVSDNSVQVEDASNYGVPQRRKRMIVKLSRLGEIPITPVQENKITVRECFKLANLKTVGASGDSLHDYIPKRSKKVQDIINAIPRNGGSRKDLPEHLVLECHKKNPTQFNDVYGRMKWDDVSPTITGGCISPSKGRFLHPEEDRCITLREASLLQTFPKDYKFATSNQTAIALMIGNALPPEFIRRQAIILKSHLLKS